MIKQPWYARFLPQPTQLAETTEKTTIIVNKEPLGVSGTEKYGGVFSEDYFRTLLGPKKAKEYDRMRRGDARVKMCLSAVKNPMRSADWMFMPAEGDIGEESKKHAAFLNFIFKEDIGVVKKKKFKTLLNEAMSVCDFGFSIFERAHKIGQTHPEFGQYVGLSALGWRSPKTLEQFITDPNGELIQVEQQSYGDIDKTVKMDARFLSIMTLDQEGDNYEGISLLRPCYGAWSRKQVYLKLMAIGIEKSAIPTVKAKVPAGKETSDEYDKMVDILEKLTSHQSNYIAHPEGWEIDTLTINFDAGKVKDAIQFENEEMTFAFLANFLSLGAGGNGGAYALSADLSDFFTKSILYIADLVSDEFNEVGKELIELNFGPQAAYPKMVPQGIIDEISEAWGNLLKHLTDSKHITPDDNIEELIRKRMKLPAMREEDKGRRDERYDKDMNPPEPPTPALTEKKSQRIQLAESKAQKKLGDAQDRIRLLLKKHLKNAKEGVVDQIMKNYENLSDAQKLDAINGVSSSGSREFQAALKLELTEVAVDSMNAAAKEVPVRKPKLAIKKVIAKNFEDLPKGIQKRITSQSRLLVTTTLNDMEKVVFLQFGDSIISTDSAALIAQDIGEAADTFIDGASVSAAGGNAGSRLVNEARTAYFFDDEVLEEIESFTFVNGDPVSPICQELDGQTCSKADVEALRLFPPLHHNCKSYIVPNLVGDKDAPKVTGFSTKHTPGL